ncbi:MAG: hypothetical protein IT196_25005 [Acidimicrobiales bacterium]|nr:hypothetical protein [Acidimicrobiales bacterium]
MSKRNSPAPRPTLAGEWEILLADSQAAAGWDVLCKQQPGPLRDLYDRLTVDPRYTPNRQHQGPLKRPLDKARVGGVELAQWQFEMAGGARVWYAIDDEKKRVWVTKASARHPNETKK